MITSWCARTLLKLLSEEGLGPAQITTERCGNIVNEGGKLNGKAIVYSSTWSSSIVNEVAMFSYKLQALPFRVRHACEIFSFPSLTRLTRYEI